MTQDILALGDFAKIPVQGAEFHRLASPNHALPPSPRFLFGSLPASVMSHYFSLIGLSSIGVFSLREFELHGAFLLKCNEIYYRCPELNVHELHIEAEIARVSGATTRAHRHLEGKHVVLAGPGYKVYGHWLVEYLPKISLLNFAGYDIFALRYLLPSDTPSYVKNWLTLLGIGPEQVIFHNPYTEVIVADQLLLPTIMHNGARMSPLFSDAAMFLRGLLAARHDLGVSTHGSRILLSRINQGRRLTNRDRIESLAAAAGFVVVLPEELPLLEQIRLFAGAREIIGEYGSALHGTMFSSTGVVVCAFRGTGRHPGFIQSGMGAVMGQPTGYVFGTMDGPDANSSFKIEEDAVVDALRLAFGGLVI